MDFSVIFQLRTKKYWWMDVIFYFVVSLLLATVLCYAVFLVKNNWQRADLAKEETKLAQVGTTQDKQYEQTVMSYKQKISDFSTIFKNHEFASNAFAFMQTQTMPNVWFKQFSLDEGSATISLAGEADSLDALSRQVASLEKNKYVNDLGNLSSSLGDASRVEFSLSITLDPSIFTYLSDMTPILDATLSPGTVSSSPATGSAGTVPTSNPLTSNTSATNTAGAVAANASGSQQFSNGQTGQDLITSFHLLMNPEVIGVVNEQNFTVTLSVPFGTDVTKLIPIIVSSPGTTVSPLSNSPQDFSSPSIYTVTDQNGGSQDYTVTVNVLPEVKPQQKTTNQGALIGIIAGIILVVILGGVGFIFWRKFKIQKPIV